MAQTKTSKTVFVAGATGYIGGRLTPRLLEAGYRVRALTRSPDKLRNRHWAEHPNLEIVRGDVLDRTSLEQSLENCGTAYYLINSIHPVATNNIFADRQAASSFATAAESADLQRIVYLSRLSAPKSKLSRHIQSHTEIVRILQWGKVPVTVLRAAMIIGSGSASFEILRYLVERQPAMLTPLWADTTCQPISIRNVLHYLIGCLDCPESTGQTLDIGQPEELSFRRLMEIYAEEAGLPQRPIFTVPLYSAKFSSFWIHLITPITATLARPLIETLCNQTPCRNTRICELMPQDLLDCRQAIKLALEKLHHQQVETSWSDSGSIPPAEWSMPEDPFWAGGNVYDDSRQVILDASPEKVWPALSAIGGEVGWYYANWLWQLRGLIDRLAGGVGLVRGRRNPAEINPGDALDFWRVVSVEPPKRLLLSAEMKLPGEAVLCFSLRERNDGRTELRQIARFLPRGILGLVYWYAVKPFHNYIFCGMLRGIAQSINSAIESNPERILNYREEE